MRYLKNLQTNQILSFESWAAIGDGFKDWTEASAAEILAIELEKAKNKKTAEIREKKESELYKPVAYLGKTFAASERASGNITASLVLNGETVNWLDNDGNPVSMTRAEFQGLGIAIKNQRSLVYFKESQKYQEIAAASTIEQVNAITW